MKKLLSLVMALLVVFGCMSFAAADDRIEIEYIFGLGGSLGDIYLGLIDEFNASQDTYVVKPIQCAAYGEAAQQYQAGLAAGDPPTMWHTQMSRVYKFGDYFEILDDRYANDPEFDPDDILPGAMACLYDVKGEHIVGVPLFATTQVAYYRKDAFEGYDIEETFKSWQNLAKVVEELVASGKFQYGWEPMWGDGNMQDAVFAAGGSFYADEDKKTVNFLSQPWIDVMTFFHDHLHVKKDMAIHHGGTGWEYWYATIDDVMNGVAAGYTGSPGDCGDIDWDKCFVHRQPGWGENPCKSQTDAHLVIMSASATPEEKDGAWEFMKFLSTPYAQAKVSMVGGYIATHKSVINDPDYAKFIEEKPYAKVILDALNYTTMQHMDITGGYIDTAVADMIDRVQIEGMDPVEALTILQEEAQAALDEFWAEQE